MDLKVARRAERRAGGWGVEAEDGGDTTKPKEHRSRRDSGAGSQSHPPDAGDLACAVELADLGL